MSHNKIYMYLENKGWNVIFYLNKESVRKTLKSDKFRHLLKVTLNLTQVSLKKPQPHDDLDQGERAIQTVNSLQPTISTGTIKL